MLLKVLSSLRIPCPSCRPFSQRATNHNDLSAALASLCRSHAVTLQWNPSHCNMPGNEAADFLAKGGGGGWDGVGGGGLHKKEQLDRSASYAEVKTILKAKQYSKWRLEHPQYNKTDPTTFLTRREQVTVFVLRTGHKRLNQSKPLIGHTEQCPCGTGSETSEHLLRSCPLYKPLRKGIWPYHTPVARNS